MAVGAAVAAVMARTGSRIATGMLVAALAYVLVLLPIVAATGPSDVSVADSVGFGLILAVPLGCAGSLGAFAGAAIGAGRAKRRR